MTTQQTPAAIPLHPPHCAQFVAENPDAFPSISSFRWFVHRHRKTLAERGAILIHRGRMHVDPEQFRASMRDIASAEALARANRGGS
jgi:hypothetical protein